MVFVMDFWLLENGDPDAQQWGVKNELGKRLTAKSIDIWPRQ